MATRQTLIDDEGNAMECFLNKNNTVQINVATDSDELLSTASISLHKEHVKTLIAMLQHTLNSMEDSTTFTESVVVN